MKKRYLIVILCIIAICILVVIFIVKNKKTINNYDNLVFEYNQKVKVSDIIPVRKDEYINTLKIGKNNLKYEIDKTIYNITYEVVDTSAPLVLLNSTYTYNIGDENDLKKRILCADNYDKRPNCFIEGTYNFNIIGNYNLKYIAIDSFNNKTEKEFTLIAELFFDCDIDLIINRYMYYSIYVTVFMYYMIYILNLFINVHKQKI